MKLILDGHDMGYEMGNLCFLFFPGEKVETVRGERPDGDWARTRLKRLATRACAYVTVSRGGKSARAVSYTPEGSGGDPKEGEFALGRAFYKAASRLCGFRPPWGILTGIRPAKLARGMLAQGQTPGDVVRRLVREHYVTPGKASLCVETAQREEKIVRLSTPGSVSLYIAIPFCPTRCLYCSFISSQVERNRRLVPEYVRLLCRELAAAGEIVERLGLRLETVYMGGGTPTSLEAPELERIFDTVKKSFHLETAREYTVEAGRPDTITAEKLAAIKEGGATRLCINPQTLDDAVLRNIGREHTARQFFDAMALARAADFRSINTDLIAGLPGDTPAGFQRTLDGILALRPEAVTVHTLAMKRSSRLVTGGGAPYDARGEAADAMLGAAAEKLGNAGLAPYYLYRQRNTTGNLENVGYALPGCECLYNIFIMDETHTVLSAGAGGVTKLRAPYAGRIERIFNFKYPFEYISRFDEMLARKKQVEKFYDDNDWKNENTAAGGQ